MDDEIISFYSSIVDENSFSSSSDFDVDDTSYCSYPDNVDSMASSSVYIIARIIESMESLSTITSIYSSSSSISTIEDEFTEMDDDILHSSSCGSIDSSDSEWTTDDSNSSAGDSEDWTTDSSNDDSWCSFDEEYPEVIDDSDDVAADDPLVSSYSSADKQYHKTNPAVNGITYPNTAAGAKMMTKVHPHQQIVAPVEFQLQSAILLHMNDHQGNLFSHVTTTTQSRPHQGMMMNMLKTMMFASVPKQQVRLQHGVWNSERWHLRRIPSTASV
eukprot:scaffold918_cov126-Cylindrotheca_fusiformis.AAC.88